MTFQRYTMEEDDAMDASGPGGELPPEVLLLVSEQLAGKDAVALAMTSRDARAAVGRRKRARLVFCRI